MENPTSSQVKGRFDEYRQARIKEGKKLATINREHAYLRAVFNELKRLGQFSGENPLAEMRQFQIAERELSYLSKDQMDELLTALEKGPSKDAYLVCKMALSTGGRWGETEALQKSQIRNGQVQFAQTKSGKTRSVPVEDELAEEISEHIKQIPTGTERVFASCYGAFREAIDRTSIKLPEGQLTHVLRHTFASHFMMNGGNILVLQRVLGHASLQMTMRYAHLAPDHLQEVLRLNPLARKPRDGWQEAKQVVTGGKEKKRQKASIESLEERLDDALKKFDPKRHVEQEPGRKAVGSRKKKAPDA